VRGSSPRAGTRRNRTGRLLAAAALGVGLLALAPAAGAQPDKPTSFNFTMSGAQVVPGPGDPDGTANANVSLHFQKLRGRYAVCAAINPQNVARPITVLELHRGLAGEAGPVVAALTEAGASDLSGCAFMDSKALLRDIQANPEQYYLDAHNAEFPDGAIRGQLG
jgi:CHRD domain